MADEPEVPATDEKVSVLIVENHAIYRRGLCAQFAVDPAIEVLAECDTAAEAVRKALELRPSVVLMDLHLPWAVGRHPTYCGARAILQILQEWPGANIAVITMFEDDERVREALKAGARSFISKDGEPAELIQMVHLTAKGTGVLNRKASEYVAKSLPHSANGSRHFTELTPRENDVLALAAAGNPDSRIAVKLDVATKTVANNWTNIRQKLGVSSREEAVELARDNDFRQDGGPGEPG
ncbi:response regulator transcription factor [Actinophytocola oryzae]|uniref:DNA-binding NarL/FixJ family response regulator n=1 Tax=Actinophytocola oryzae TaxID=502181 RepID=A0A4V3FTN6_9PSEU|nr:response regulator transcription factor [Actinophytocola oryzae]TDV52031.1 DNA-binding NarL/FixJ family response regulator [Actinophytocola oryzae]